jgi:hypothetical protein
MPKAQETQPIQHATPQGKIFFGPVADGRRMFRADARQMGLLIHEDLLAVDDACDEDDVLEMPIERDDYAIFSEDEAECYVVDERHMRAPSLGMEKTGQGFVPCEGVCSFDVVFDEPVCAFALEVSGLGEGSLTLALDGQIVINQSYSLASQLGKGFGGGGDKPMAETSVSGGGLEVHVDSAGGCPEGRAFLGVIASKPFEVITLFCGQEQVAWGGTVFYAWPE